MTAAFLFFGRLLFGGWTAAFLFLGHCFFVFERLLFCFLDGCFFGGWMAAFIPDRLR